MSLLHILGGAAAGYAVAKLFGRSDGTGVSAESHLHLADNHLTDAQEKMDEGNLDDAVSAASDARSAALAALAIGLDTKADRDWAHSIIELAEEVEEAAKSAEEEEEEE